MYHHLWSEVVEEAYSQNCVKITFSHLADAFVQSDVQGRAEIFTQKPLHTAELVSF